CWRQDGFRILAGDQIYLRLDRDRLFAHPCPVTVRDFNRSSAGVCSEPREVRALIHLVQKGGYAFRKLDRPEAFPHFMRETIYQKEYRNGPQLMSVASRMIQSPGIPNAEMSYPKGESFWGWLDAEIEGMGK